MAINLRRATAITVVVVATSAIAAAVAGAFTVNVSDVDLVLYAPKGGVFEIENGNPGNDECLTGDIADVDVYSPIGDGGIGDSSDAFDGGVALVVNGNSYGTPGDKVNYVANRQVTTGRRKMSGLSVVRKDRLIGNLIVMRSLVTFTNKGNSKKTVTAAIESDFGADGDEVVRDSSTGPKLQFTKADRWVVIADDLVSPGDAIVGLAYAGKGHKFNQITDGIPNSDGCLNIAYKVRVPAKSARSIVVFTQLSREDAANAARKKIKVFNRKKLPKIYAAGLSKSARKHVINWNF